MFKSLPAGFVLWLLVPASTVSRSISSHLLLIREHSCRCFTPMHPKSVSIFIINITEESIINIIMGSVDCSLQNLLNCLRK